MNVEHSRRALADLEQIVAYCRHSQAPEAAKAPSERIHSAAARIARRVAQRKGVHVAPLIRYPYKIFCCGSKRTFAIAYHLTLKTLTFSCVPCKFAVPEIMAAI